MIPPIPELFNAIIHGISILCVISILLFIVLGLIGLFHDPLANDNWSNEVKGDDDN